MGWARWLAELTPAVTEGVRDRAQRVYAANGVGELCQVATIPCASLSTFNFSLTLDRVSGRRHGSPQSGEVR